MFADAPLAYKLSQFDLPDLSFIGTNEPSLNSQLMENDMDKDRVVGAAHQAKGAVKEAAGKVTGDEKLKIEGQAEKVAGKMQNAVGGAKDAVRDAVKK